MAEVCFLGCLNDVRYNDVWFPLAPVDNGTSQAAYITAAVNVVEGCASNACFNIECPENMTCLDLWRDYKCV